MKRFGMTRIGIEFGLLLWLAGGALAQGGEPPRGQGERGGEPVATEQPAVRVSDAGRQALAAAKALVGEGRGLRGSERARVVERAASAYDKVVADFAGEPAFAAAAAYAAADLWRQHGSLPLAEKDYLRAVQADPGRFTQRGLCGAADMQRRQKRFDEAMATYGRAIAAEPGSTRAQEARLWLGRVLQSTDRIDEAIRAFENALESAGGGVATTEAANYLALAWIAKGDLEAAARAIDHAEQHGADASEDDPIVAERQRKAIEAMSARKALQRARDKQNGAGEDAVRLERAQRTGEGEAER